MSDESTSGAGVGDAERGGQPRRVALPGVAPAEGRLQVARTARYFQLGQISDATRQLWFVCHGYRQLASRFVHLFAGLAELGVVVVAPEALSRFYIDPGPGRDPGSGRHGPEDRVGASWMTRVDREAEIGDYVRYLDQLARALGAGTGGDAKASELRRRGPDRPRVVALGFSQGVQTAARWAVLGKTPVDELVLWGAYLPADLPIGDAFRRLRLTLVFGENDPTWDPKLACEQDERLAAAGVEPTRIASPGGHRVDRAVVRAMAESFGGTA